MTEWRNGPNGWEWDGPDVRLGLDPLRGLLFLGKKKVNAPSPQILGVEIVDAVGLGSHSIHDTNTPLHVHCHQNIAFVAYKPTEARPVECHARWRIHEEPIFDLEVSTLTPGKWDGLSVRTRSCLPADRSHQLETQLLVLLRLEDSPVSYIEMCHPHDGFDVDLSEANTIRFRLFGHDLEKGVILRGRLRGMIVPRERDEAIALEAYQQFLHEPPNLSAH
jgi:hypothetical protein